jgi:Arylsulfotransferase (ASST)
MRRKLLILLGTAVLVWAILAIALGSASLRLTSGSTAAALSPACLPATLRHSAALGGTGVDVSPAPNSGLASPRTQISFLGAPAARIAGVSVVGSRSGRHAGRLRPYSQGDGASFQPTRPFDAGERVTVSATIGGRRSTFAFGVDTPFSTAHVPEFPAPPASPADYQSFYSRPGVQAPILSVTTPDRDPAAGLVFVTNGPGPGQYGPLIYRPDGRLVWFDKLEDEITAEDLNVQSYEGRRSLTWWKGRVLSLGFGQGEDVVMNDRYQIVARVPGGNGLKADLHDFQLAAGGVAYITAFNPVLCNMRSIGGSERGTIIDTAIQQIDVKTGLVRWEWHSLDHVGPAESEVEVPKGTEPWDYFHLNSIDPQPNGDLVISSRSTWAAYRLQAGSGRILWTLGGNKSSFRMGPGTKTAWQHDARMLSNGQLTLFDDGANPPIHHESRAIRIAIDTRTHTARLVSSLTHRDPPLLAASQGNMQTLPNGNTLVGYGGVPAISEYAPDGTLLFDAHLPYSQAFYRAFRHPWTARPAEPPSILASLNNTSEETIVHASWNGATGVASWRVLGGAKASALSLQATIPAGDYESQTTLPKKLAYAEVQALDSGAHVLASSKPVAVVSFRASLPGG